MVVCISMGAVNGL